MHDLVTMISIFHTYVWRFQRGMTISHREQGEYINILNTCKVKKKKKKK